MVFNLTLLIPDLLKTFHTESRSVIKFDPYDLFLFENNISICNTSRISSSCPILKQTSRFFLYKLIYFPIPPRLRSFHKSVQAVLGVSGATWYSDHGEHTGEMIKSLHDRFPIRRKLQLTPNRYIYTGHTYEKNIPKIRTDCTRNVTLTDMYRAKSTAVKPLI